MTDRTNRSRTERLKYGICLNDECEKCKTKEVQQIPMRKELICTSCGKELRECPPPKKGGKGKIIVIIIVLLAIIATAMILFLSGPKHNEEPVSNGPVEPLQQDTVQIAVSADSVITRSDTVINTTMSTDVLNEGSKIVKSTVQTTETTITTQSTSTSKSSSSGNGSSTLNLSYGTYKGEIKNGYPNGMGRLTYSKTRQINRHDTKGREANAGDYVIGEFVNGFFVQGKHYNSDGNLIESLIIGVSADDEFESK